MFKPSRRHRFFKVWLIAIACQTGQLFSQIENAYDQPYYNGQSQQPWYGYGSEYSSDPRGTNNASAYDYPSNHDDWHTPQGISSEQVQTIVYPDDSSKYSPPQPYYYTPNNSQYALEPQNGQWPATSQNEWQEPTNQQAAQYYYEQQNFQLPIENSQNGQWSSATSQNEWQEPTNQQAAQYYYEQQNFQLPIENSQNGQWSSATYQNEWQALPIQSEMQFYPGQLDNQNSIGITQNREWTTPNEWQMPTTPVQPNSSPWQSPYEQYQTQVGEAPSWPQADSFQQDLTNWQESFAPNSQEYPTTQEAASFNQRQPSESHFSSEFISFPPAQTGVDKQNFIVFDPDLEEAPDKEQHPLSKDGEATAYHFEKDGSTEVAPIASQALQQASIAVKEASIPSKIEVKTKMGDKASPNLAEGKGNIKVIKKRSEPVPPARRLEEALNQPEEIIGKSAVSEPVIGMTDDTSNSQSPLNDDDVDREFQIKGQPKQFAQTNSNAISNDEQIAQALRPLATPQPTQKVPTALTPPRTPTIITPTTQGPDVSAPVQTGGRALKEISINFNNVAMIEYIRFISRISNKNFIFDDEDLQFNVTIVSEEPTTIDNLMAALLQELRIRDLSLMEQGNNIIIHRNPRVRAPARIVSDNDQLISSHESELVTRVFRLNTLDPVKASEIIRPLLSEDALIEVLRDTNNLIITDLVTNINKITQLISTLDAPNSGVTIGQYVVRNAFVDSLVDLANKILQPIAQGNPFVLVPHPVSNSIFIVSNSFIVEKALAILQNLDLNEGRTKILSLETLQPAYPSYTPSTGAGTIPGRAGNLPGGTTGTFPGGAAGGVSGRVTPGGITGGFGPNGAGGYGPNGTGGFGPGGFGPGGLGELGPGGTVEGNYGPGGQFANPDAIPESFPLGGLGSGGSLNLPPVPGVAGAPGIPGSIFSAGGIGAEGRPSAIFDESRNFMPGGIGAASRWAHELPVGHIERTMFFIYKLRYRKGDSIEIALRKIANSLQLMGTANADLISAINSSQWIESSNALIFTGTAAALEKVRELILEVDVPLRQVFIEMLILNTTITDSLGYSVDWINRLGGGTTTGEQGFFEAAPGTGLVSLDNFAGAAQTIFPNGAVINPPQPAQPLPVATNFLNSGGFAAGIIGTHLTHNGTRFNSIGALVRAIHSDTKADIILNPKIITEDNNPAEIFVGGTDRYKTQSITNDLGSLVTNNFQFIDVGTTLRVTPLIGNNGIVTLEIVQETTAEDAAANSPLNNANNQSVNLVPVLTKTRTVTKVHVPNGFFVVLSGMIQDNETRQYTRIPCLGGIPILGCIGKTVNNTDNKRNLMLFIRPLIIETDEDYEDITRRQQDVYREKCKFRRSWNYEIDEAMNFANIKSTDPDDMNCSCSDREHR